MDRTGVLEILWKALLRSDNPKISDVDVDTSVNGEDQIILTTEDEQGEKQVWIFSEDGISEHDAEHVEPEPLTFAHLFKPGYGIMLLTEEEMDTLDWYLPEPNTEDVGLGKFNIVNEGEGLLLASYGDEDVAIHEFLRRLDATHD